MHYIHTLFGHSKYPPFDLVYFTKTCIYEIDKLISPLCGLWFSMKYETPRGLHNIKKLMEVSNKTLIL